MLRNCCNFSCSRWMNVMTGSKQIFPFAATWTFSPIFKECISFRDPYLSTNVDDPGKHPPGGLDSASLALISSSNFSYFSFSFSLRFPSFSRPSISLLFFQLFRIHVKSTGIQSCLDVLIIILLRSFSQTVDERTFFKIHFVDSLKESRIEKRKTFVISTALSYNKNLSIGNG